VGGGIPIRRSSVEIISSFIYKMLNIVRPYLDKLIKLNNKLLRILRHEPISTPASHLYRTYNTLPIPDLHKQQLLYFVYKCIHHPELLPEIFHGSNYYLSTRSKGG